MTATEGAIKVFLSDCRRDMAAADALFASLEPEGGAVSIYRRDVAFVMRWLRLGARWPQTSRTVSSALAPSIT